MSLLQMSFSGGVMIGVICILRAVLLNKVPKRTFLALWGVAVLRLLIPYSLSSAYSVYSRLWDRPQVMETVRQTAASTLLPMATEFQETVASGAETSSSLSIWGILWLVGVTAAALGFGIAYFRCYREFRTAVPVEHEFTAAWLEAHPLKRGIVIRQSDRITSPLTYGIFRPVILLPKSIDWENTRQLDFVLEHEFVHIKRFDTVKKLVLICAICVHWFNPLVWVMYILFNRDVELSCDEGVVGRLGQENRPAYANALIDLEEARSSPFSMVTFFGKNTTKERIVAIMKWKKKSTLTVLLAAVLVAATTVAFATTPETDSATDSAASVEGSEETLQLVEEEVDGQESSEDAPQVGDTLTLVEREPTEEELAEYQASQEWTPDEETAYYAYLDLDSADPETQEKILAARSEIINHHSWTTYGYSSSIIQIGEDGTYAVLADLPTFYDLFPADWDIPSDQ